MLNEFSTLKNGKENFFKKVNCLDNGHNCLLAKNKSLALEIEGMRKKIGL